MPVYMCRWPNGDFSFVSTANKQEAVEALDEIDNAEGCPLSVVREFMVHFRLDDDGTFELEGFGEVTETTIWEDYPVLDETLDHIFKETAGAELTRQHMQVIGEAVSQERERVKPKKAKQPETRLEQKMKRTMDTPTTLIDREVKKRAKETLKNFKPKGKPN